MIKQCFFFFLSIFFFSTLVYAQDPLLSLRETTLSYFKPIKGRVISVQDGIAVSDLGAASGIREGMRLHAFREGMPFLHPVTKEPMGNVETPSGKVEAKQVSEGGSTLAMIVGTVKEGDIVRIPDMKMKVLFYQDRSVEWALGESYYQSLQKSGRLQIIDTSLDSGDDAAIIAEAKKLNAEVALVLTQQDAEGGVLMKQRLFWVSDAVRFAEHEVKLDAVSVRELRSAQNTLAPALTGGDALLTFDLPFSAELIAAGDVNGDRKQELILSSGKTVYIYASGGSLQKLHEIVIPKSGDHLRIDTMDINGDGRDEIVITTLKSTVDIKSVGSDEERKEPGVLSVKDGEVVSYIYELRGPEFSMFWKGNLFLRVIDTPQKSLIAQNYNGAEGFTGPVYAMVYTGETLRSGDTLKLPKGVNIYDFVLLRNPEGPSSILAYDESGYLNLYNAEGLKIWRSKDDYGGFLMSFKKTAPTMMVDRGTWSVKDRLQLVNKNTFIVRRIPLAQAARGLGYKSSQIKTLLWTGLSMEETTFIDTIPGGMLDFAFTPDRVIVLTKPLFGLKTKNILKGESPLGSMVYIYSLKGR